MADSEPAATSSNSGPVLTFSGTGGVLLLSSGLSLLHLALLSAGTARLSSAATAASAASNLTCCCNCLRSLLHSRLCPASQFALWQSLEQKATLLHPLQRNAGLATSHWPHLSSCGTCLEPPTSLPPTAAPVPLLPPPLPMAAACLCHHAGASSSPALLSWLCSRWRVTTTGRLQQAHRQRANVGGGVKGGSVKGGSGAGPKQRRAYVRLNHCAWVAILCRISPSTGRGTSLQDGSFCPSPLFSPNEHCE